MVKIPSRDEMPEYIDVWKQFVLRISAALKSCGRPDALMTERDGTVTLLADAMKLDGAQLRIGRHDDSNIRAGHPAACGRSPRRSFPHFGTRFDNPVIDTLVVLLGVTIIHEFAGGGAQRLLAEKDDSFDGFLFQRSENRSGWALQFGLWGGSTTDATPDDKGRFVMCAANGTRELSTGFHARTNSIANRLRTRSFGLAKCPHEEALQK